jgi:hypothetical protein
MYWPERQTYGQRHCEEQGRKAGWATKQSQPVSPPNAVTRGVRCSNLTRRQMISTWALAVLRMRLLRQAHAENQPHFLAMTHPIQPADYIPAGTTSTAAPTACAFPSTSHESKEKTAEGAEYTEVKGRRGSPSCLCVLCALCGLSLFPPTSRSAPCCPFHWACRCRRRSGA